MLPCLKRWINVQLEKPALIILGIWDCVVLRPVRFSCLTISVEQYLNGLVFSFQNRSAPTVKLRTKNAIRRTHVAKEIFAIGISLQRMLPTLVLAIFAVQVSDSGMDSCIRCASCGFFRFANANADRLSGNDLLKLKKHQKRLRNRTNHVPLLY